MDKFSIATNITSADLPRIKYVIPSWQESFKDRLGEIVIIYDTNKLSGRIQKLHSKTFPESDIIDAIDILKRKFHCEIKLIYLDYDKLKATSNQWFKSGTPIKCRSGSPVFAFIESIRNCSNNIVLKCDCDVVFLNTGFLEQVKLHLENYDIVSPPRLYFPEQEISSRAFFLNTEKFYKRCLPLVSKRINIYEAFKYFLKGKNLFNVKKYSFHKAFEDILIDNFKAKTIQHKLISADFGNSLHIISNDDLNQEITKNAIKRYIENRDIPELQKNAFDYDIKFWIN